MKLGVITDGISRNLEHALTLMKQSGLEYAELQFIDEFEVGDMNDHQIAKVKNLVDHHEVKVSCISRHVFGGLPLKNVDLNSANYKDQIDALKRCIKMAKALNCDTVRTMSFSKEMIIFGSHGADVWNVSTGAWQKLVALMAGAVETAEKENITLVVETGNNAMITSAWLARKLINELGSKHLKLLWDPCNSLYCAEKAYPDAYEAIGVENIGHIHLKDSFINIPHATVECTALNKGDMAPYLSDIADALRRDNYQGSISLESVYRPSNATFEDGFKESLPIFLELFKK